MIHKESTTPAQCSEALRSSVANKDVTSVSMSAALIVPAIPLTCALEQNSSNLWNMSSPFPLTTLQHFLLVYTAGLSSWELEQWLPETCQLVGLLLILQTMTKRCLRPEKKTCYRQRAACSQTFCMIKEINVEKRTDIVSLIRFLTLPILKNWHIF